MTQLTNGQPYRPLDHERRSDLVIQGNVMHLFTLHCIGAMAMLDNAHRYRPVVVQHYDLDERKAHAEYGLSYTYKGKTVDAKETMEFLSVRRADTGQIVDNSKSLIERLSRKCLEVWEAAHG